ncbi:MAG TPA: LacI family DNA-binding transcriptional regulator [Segeticoccus sp.]|uniref:LacI family DNA-binding transcriptional regulator n=1 Tax=Segeticoccus sp. TaxID=2706531 RepID=UPI002D7E6C26|nr:LacI family DNA-binding transcriptional regulator [Segeticoccus sp.]HET8600843.1 LacI family DNA-binding transcriptional regulator [Segeticoccus sp.]
MVQDQSSVEQATARPRVRMADIARELGISKAAVSYALNGLPGVAADTRQRVLDLARERGWHASSSARALSGARTGVVGLVLSRPTDVLTAETFFIRFLAGVESVLNRSGGSLLLKVIGDHPELEIATYERWWGERRIDGVLMVDERYRDARVDAVARLGVPAVLCGGPVKAAQLPCLWTDQAADAAIVVEHLARLGHRRVAHISGPLEFAHERGRRRGVRRAARDRGMEVTTVAADYTGPQAGEETARLMRAPEPPTAIVYGNDVMAVSGMGALAEAGCRVPEDVSVVSWDDSALTCVTRPTITALWRDTPAYGATAARLLLDLVDGKQPGPVQVAASALRERDSTAAVR